VKTFRTTALAVAAMVSTAGTCLLSQSAVATATPRGVCHGYDRCHVVAKADVDGDRRADAIGYQRLAGDRTAVVRVLTASGDRLSRRVDVRGWFGGGRWGGATHIDGVHGVEILVGSTLGAHTPFYTMLTYRDGRLLVEQSPRGERTWFVDAAASVYFGWWRKVSDGRVTITSRSALLHAHGAWSGSDIRYRWQADHWQKVSRTKHLYAGPRAASKIYGWHVNGLDREPGL
jgi:hypothetical protein